MVAEAPFSLFLLRGWPWMKRVNSSENFTRRERQFKMLMLSGRFCPRYLAGLQKYFLDFSWLPLCFRNYVRKNILTYQILVTEFALVWRKSCFTPAKVKGGKLAAACHPSNVALISIIMSDIVGRLKFLRNLNDYRLTFLKNFSKNKSFLFDL